MAESVPQHSPFFIKQEFISPLECDKILQIVRFGDQPNVDKDQRIVKTMMMSDLGEELIFEKILPLIPEIENHYEIEYGGTERMTFEWYAQDCAQQSPECNNSKFVRKKWLKTHNRDLTGIVYFCDYQDKSPFDPTFEVFGGSLQFPQHQFTINPQRGTLVMFPSYPHFVGVQSAVGIGNLYLARFHIAAKKLWLYDPKKFPGSYVTWFQNIA